MNQAQLKAYEILKKRWDIVSEPTPEIGWHKCFVVQVESLETGAKMTIGIQENGSTNS